VAWPLAARAQQPVEKLRRVGILMPYPEKEPDIQARVRAFKQELQRLGWVEGNKIEFDERWATDNMESVRSNAASLLEGKPDAVVAIGGRVIPMLKQMTRSIPIVVAGTGDPLGTGIVTSLAHPGENITGFSLLELSIIGKYLELLKQMAPNFSRVTLIFNPDNASTRFFKQEFDSAAPALGVDPMVAPIHGLVDVERAIEERATSPNGGLLFAPDVTVTALRQRILALVARSRLPAIYPVGERWGSDVVRTRSARHISTSGLVYRPDTSRRKTRRFAGPATHEIRTRDKPENRKGTRS